MSSRARAEAAEETGRRIVGAFNGRLMGQWFDEITLDAVAADAGVTVQTVVRRFGGKEGLLGAGLKEIGREINAQRGVPAGDVDRVVKKVIEDYERTGDAVLRLLALEPRHSVLTRFLDFGRGEHRKWVGAAFEGELKGLANGERERVVDLLVVATDVYTWKLLRRDMKRGVGQTESAMKRLVQGVIDGILKV